MRNPIVPSQLMVGLALVGFLALGASANAWAQTSAVAPTLIPVSGELRGADGQPRTGPVLLVIALYEGREDVAPRWIEHQPVTLDATGRYSVQFGGTRDEGLPTDLFAGDAGTRWIGVAVEGEPEQPRVTLVSVPYAARAASADLLAGKPLTEFVLTSTLQDDVRAVLQEDGVATSAAVTANFLQKGNGSGGTTDSSAFEINGDVGIGTTTPAARLSVNVSSSSTVPLGSFNNLPLLLQNTSSTNNNWALVGFRDAAGNFGGYFGAQTTNQANGTADFVLASNPGSGATERLRIRGNGNVGIGTATAQSRLSVNVASASTVPLSTFDNLPLLLQNTSSTNNNWALVGFRDAAGNFGGYFGAQTTNQANGTADFVLASNPGTGATERLRILGNGNVGIGTAAPTAKLHVLGNATVTGDLVIDGNIAAKYQDVAEWVDATETLAPGTIVVIDTTATNRVAAAAQAYDARVAGAVSPQPGLTLGEPGAGKALVAQSGRVRIKVDATFGAIRPGDLLVSSPTTGHAMRADAKKVRPGTVIGKALEALPGGRGEILALLTLQ